MNRYRIFSSILGVIFLGGILANSRFSPYPQKPQDPTLFQKVLPDTQDILFVPGDPPFYEAFRLDPASGRSRLTGYAFFTAQTAPDIKGYAGPINILVGINPQGAIEGIHLISHSETVSYTGPLQPWLKQFIGLDIHDDLSLGQDIDGISGATVTSTAVIQSIAESLKRIPEHITKTALQTGSLSAQTENHFAFGKAGMICLLFILAALTLLKRLSFLRWIVMAVSLLYLGFLTHNMFSAVDIVNAGLGHFPGLETGLVHLTLLSLAMIGVLLFGRLYCGTLCPFALVQEMFYNVFQRLSRGKKLAITDRTDHILKAVKYFVLITVVGLSLWLGQAAPAEVEVFLSFFSGQGSWWIWFLLFITLSLSCVHMRFWCRYLCPTGAFLGLCAQMSLFKIRLEPCRDCKKCEGICPTNAISRSMDKQTKIDWPECVLCGRCLKTCPNGRLKFFSRKNDERR